VTSDVPLYERDPAAWNAYLAEGNAKQARKRVSADALIRDPRGRILLVDPGYKPGWDLPGGMAEANESPAAALRRELNEELGIDLNTGPLLCVDWVPPPRALGRSPRLRLRRRHPHPGRPSAAS